MSQPELHALPPQNRFPAFGCYLLGCVLSSKEELQHPVLLAGSDGWQHLVSTLACALMCSSAAISCLFPFPLLPFWARSRAGSAHTVLGAVLCGSSLLHRWPGAALTELLGRAESRQAGS